jgi:hypothetical protein
VVLAGRASMLHPLILQSMRAAMPADTDLTQSVGQAHYAAARIAAAQNLGSGPSDLTPPLTPP